MIAISDAGAATAARIREFLTSRFPLAQHLAVADDAPLLDAGIIDSLGVLDVLTFLEQTFAIRVVDDELKPENFCTIGALVRFVESKR